MAVQVHHTNLRSMCDFQYGFVGADGETAFERGVVRIKYVSEKTEAYKVVDLIKRRPPFEMCDNCSQRSQRPVRHAVEGSECLGESVPGDVELDRSHIATPDASRICGPQIQKGKKRKRRTARPTDGAAASATARVQQYQCRSPMCSKQYKRVQGVNKHMKDKHPEENLTPYTVPVAVGKQTKSLAHRRAIKSRPPLKSMEIHTGIIMKSN